MSNPEDRARDLGVPLIPKRPPSSRKVDPNPIIAVCGECGLEVHRVMGYSCPRTNCPVFPHCTFNMAGPHNHVPVRELDAVGTTGGKATVEKWR